jgi:hypothetical protein
VSTPNFTIRHDHYHHSQEVEEQMAKLTDAVVALQTEVRETAANTKAKVEELNARIAALEAKEVVTDEDLAAIEQIRMEVDAIDPTKPVILPEPTPPDEEIPQEEV